MNTAEDSGLPLISEHRVADRDSSPDHQCVDRVWLEKVIARLSRELELAEEFSRKHIPEAVQRMYLGRASALRFALGLLDESLDPLAFLKQPIPDRHWPAAFRFRRHVAALESEEPQPAAGLSVSSESELTANVVDNTLLSEK